MAEVVVRIATAVVALLVVAAFGVQLRGHDLLADGSAIAPDPKLARTEVDAAVKSLDRAQKLRPGTQALLAKAGLQLRTSQFRAAAESAKRATEMEPENFATWVTYGVAQRGLGDERSAKRAFARAKLLNPLYPTPR